MSAIAARSALPVRPFRIRDTVRIGQRWRKVGGDLVVTVRQVHRADCVVEVSVPAWACVFLQDFPRTVTFTELRDEYELLVSLKGARA